VFDPISSNCIFDTLLHTARVTCPEREAIRVHDLMMPFSTKVELELVSTYAVSEMCGNLSYFRSSFDA
jgi:hypothetical protein